MNEILSAVLIAVIVIVFIAVFFKVFAKSLMDKYLLSLFKKNEEQRKKDKEEIDSDVAKMLKGDRKQLEIIITQLKEQLEETRADSKTAQKQGAQITEQLKQVNKISEDLNSSTEGLKRLLSNNRLRGEWGEQVAEDLLLGAGFVENTNYKKQTTTSEGRPDFTIILPDKTKLNVDAKFPLDDLIAYQEATTKAQKKEALSKFEKSVRKKIQEVTSKDYIDPEAQTVDFVIMFIPNEMVFSFIYETLPQVTTYAAEKKVILTGPFGFTAMLRLVLQANKNFNYAKGLSEILGLVEKFQIEYEKYSEALSKVSRQFDSTQKAFQDVEGTRQRQLTKVVDRVVSYSNENKKLDSGSSKK